MRKQRPRGRIRNVRVPVPRWADAAQARRLRTAVPEGVSIAGSVSRSAASVTRPSRSCCTRRRRALPQREVLRRERSVFGQLGHGAVGRMATTFLARDGAPAHGREQQHHQQDDQHRGRVEREQVGALRGSPDLEEVVPGIEHDADPERGQQQRPRDAQPHEHEHRALRRLVAHEGAQRHARGIEHRHLALRLGPFALARRRLLVGARRRGAQAQVFIHARWHGRMQSIVHSLSLLCRGWSTGRACPCAAGSWPARPRPW